MSKNTGSQVCDHERLGQDLWKHIWCEDGESIIQRRPFRWMMDGRVIPNAYEMFSMESVCEDNGLEVVCTYGDSLAIVRKKNAIRFPGLMTIRGGGHESQNQNNRLI